MLSLFSTAFAEASLHSPYEVLLVQRTHLPLDRFISLPRVSAIAHSWILHHLLEFYDLSWSGLVSPLTGVQGLDPLGPFGSLGDQLILGKREVLRPPYTWAYYKLQSGM